MSVFLDLREMPTSSDTPPPSLEPLDTPKYIGTDLRIGKGSFKTVYSCKLTDRGNSLFVLPEGTDENKLCIAIVDIAELIRTQKRKDKEFITLFNEYIGETAEEKHKNKYTNNFEFIIKEEVRHIEQEIELQKELFQKQLEIAIIIKIKH